MRGKTWFAWTSVLALGLTGSSGADAAAEMVREIPTEYEATGGLGVAMNNAGYAATDAHSAVRANPALLAIDRSYSFTANYHWPRAGREFYQASVVDSKTSAIAAGVSYTGFNNDYVYPREGREDTSLDSPIIRRGVVGAAGMLGQLAIGAGGTYVEAHSLAGSQAKLAGEERVRGFGLNIGAAVAPTPQLRLGASAENLSSRRIRDYVPRTYRAGIAYLFSPQLIANLDFRQRERVVEFEAAPADPDRLSTAEVALDKPERLAIVSMTAKFAEYFTVVGSYAQATSDERRSLAGGVLVGTPKMHLSYTLSRPYMKRAGENQAIGIGFEMSM